MSSGQQARACNNHFNDDHCQPVTDRQSFRANSKPLSGLFRCVATAFAFLVVALGSAIALAQEPQVEGRKVPDGTVEILKLQETIDRLKSQGKADEAKFLTEQQELVLMLPKDEERETGAVIFGRLIVSESDDPRFCDAQMAIHRSGWFLGDVGDINEPVEFRMWGYRPAKVEHVGRRGETINVGDIVLKPFLFDELATVRAELLFENKVDPATVSVNVIMEHPPVNSRFNGTNGYVLWPEKESIAVGPDFRIQRTGLTPIPHELIIKAPGHLPLRRDFKLSSGGTTDLGVLRIAASPAFELEFAIADGLDFSKAERRKQTVYAGDRFQTNPAGKDWIEAGTLRIWEHQRVYSLDCGLSFLIVTDLGEGKLDDHLTPVHRELKQARLAQPTVIADGHIYLITHSQKTMWKHATLMRVKTTPKL